MYKLFLAIRYLRKRRIAYLAVAAVMLCTFMVLVVMSIMGGFLDQVKRKARGLLGDVVIDNGSATRGFPLYQEFIDDVSQWPEIEKATPVIYGFATLQFHRSSRVSLVQVVGIRLDEYVKVNSFGDGLYYNKFYPDTTTFKPKGQPVTGWNDRSPPAKNAPGFTLPVLPEPFYSALKRSQAAGLKNSDKCNNMLNRALRDEGLPMLPGGWRVAPEGQPITTETGQVVTPTPGMPSPPGYVDLPFDGIILGRDLVAHRESDGNYDRDYWRLPNGAPLSLSLAVVTDNAGLESPPNRPFRYVDDSRSGVYEIDSRQVYCDFSLLQKLLKLDAAPYVDDKGNEIGQFRARCSQIQVKIRPSVNGQLVNMDQMAKRLRERYHQLAADPSLRLVLREAELLQSVEARTWQESQAHIIGPVENERRLITTLFSIISIVAGVLVLCILYMIVLQKTRDIGIIKAIGGTSGGVAAIWVFYGAAVGVIGAMFGAAGGVVFVWNINEVQAFLQWAFGWQMWNREVYSFDEIPNTVRPWDVMFVMTLTILTATLGSLAAAWRAGRMQPVEAIRHE